MSTQRDYPQGNYSRTGPSRTRGFSPLFRGLYSDQHLRVSDAERQAVVDRLAEHFADGRLDQAEFDDRVGRAMNAKTRADLSGLFSDLPETGAPAVPDHPHHPLRRRRVDGHDARVRMRAAQDEPVHRAGHAQVHGVDRPPRHLLPRIRARHVCGPGRRHVAHAVLHEIRTGPT